MVGMLKVWDCFIECELVDVNVICDDIVELIQCVGVLIEDLCCIVCMVQKGECEVCVVKKEMVEVNLCLVIFIVKKYINCGL